MPVWTVQIANDEDELVEACLLATDGGALIALSEEGVLLQAWAPGEWRRARHVPPADRPPTRRSAALVGVPLA